MISKELETFWAQYLECERDRIRDLTMERLQRFIDRLLAHDPTIWYPWATELAASVSDKGADVPVRFPLFRRVLLPALVEGVQRQQPGYARWLAHFEPLLYHSEPTDLPEHLRTAMGLLQEAVRLDPTDVLARSRLVERHASYLDYTLHELPVGVLYGSNGATIEQCDELLELLSEFRGHVSVLGQAEKYTDLIDDCESHYHNYRDYLRDGRPNGSYERFIQARGGR